MTNEEYVLSKIGKSSAGGGGIIGWNSSFPSFINLETSSNCTARCVMCGIDEWKRGSAIMQEELFLKIAKEIIENKENVTKVALFVGNEPLLDSNLAQKIKIFTKENIVVNFSTNASLLDTKKSKEILESGLNNINFSIDSLDKKEYEKIRKNLIFERVMANVICFLKMRNAQNYKTTIRVSIIKSNANKECFDEIYNFWSRVLDISRGDSIRVDDLSSIYGTDSKKETIEQMQGNMQELYNRANEKPCYILWNTMVIKCDGSVALCNVDQCRNIILGDLNTQSIKEIWNTSPIKESYKEVHLKGGRGKIALCKNCLGWLE